jgi:hypothetical protein
MLENPGRRESPTSRPVFRFHRAPLAVTTWVAVMRSTVVMTAEAEDLPIV